MTAAEAERLVADIRCELERAAHLLPDELKAIGLDSDALARWRSAVNLLEMSAPALRGLDATAAATLGVLPLLRAGIDCALRNRPRRDVQ